LMENFRHGLKASAACTSAKVIFRGGGFLMTV